MRARKTVLDFLAPQRAFLDVWLLPYPLELAYGIWRGVFSVYSATGKSRLWTRNAVPRVHGPIFEAGSSFLGRNLHRQAFARSPSTAPTHPKTVTGPVAYAQGYIRHHRKNLVMADTAAQADAPTAELPHTKEKLDELASAASLQYSLKNYLVAADHYADACEIQSALNGDHAPENAELLFYYGRALYKVAVQRSDVLGGKVAQEEKKKPKAEKPSKPESSSAPSNGTTSAKEETIESKPYFQLTGDENWTDSEDEEEAEGGEGEGEEEDEFQNAFEAFEQARVLYEKQLNNLGSTGGEDKGKGKAELTPQARAIKEKLADCHGFLAEISLEAERPHDAVEDGRKALALEEELHPFEHENISSAHYSLSLALELASAVARKEDITGTNADANDAEANNETKEQEINYELRNEAAKQTDLAIRSVEARMKTEKEAFETAGLTAEEKREKLAIIKDKAAIIDEMKERVSQDPCIDPVTVALTRCSWSI